MKIDPTELPQLPMQTVGGSTKSLTSAVYHILRGSILYGHLEPETKLTVSHVATQFRVSLSAVREALARLATEGLLVTADHRGFRVAAVSKEDLLDLTQTRIDLETLALRRAIEKGDKSWEDRVREAFEALQSAERTARSLGQRRYMVHAEFHMALVEACGSPWLLRTLTMLFERAERYRLLSVTYSKIRGEVEHEHEELYKAAVLERDADKACEILAKHTRLTTEALLEASERRAAGRTAKPPSVRKPPQRLAKTAARSLRTR
ncbi:MAG: GntR family transcriptional regulator [Caulobacteraceae bacterium]|nr:GntR family transcriptional regulator [Caulobacteraceae bacterium]